MSLPLTAEMLRAMYDYLCTTPPFDRWNLPDGEEVRFRVVRDPNNRGWYAKIKGRHTIAISRQCVGHALTFMATMAHEMIHLHENNARACTRGMHSAAFKRWAEITSKYHGFDPKIF